MTESRSSESILRLSNVRMFIAFRVLFNARFYYPIFTILFLDFGLTLEQFAILNAAWAATIIIAEVPSGALADRWGRRRLVRIAGCLMVLEMILICLAPIGASPWLFWIFLVNRILSGAAEAAASGADEALAYDTLSERGREGEWPRVLEALMKLQSVGFFIAMIVGAAVYDPNLVGKVAGWFGFTREWQQDDTLRWPLYLNLLTAFGALWAAFRMIEPKTQTDHDDPSLAAPWKTTLQTGLWILRSPIPFLLIFGGLFFDSVSRVFVTLVSEYFRLIQIPEAYYGIIGAGVALLGLFLPRVARFMVENFSVLTNTLLLGAWLAASLFGLSFLLPQVGLLFAVTTMVSMRFADFFLSHYLNREVESRHRATVLSFRGLAMNLGYGGLSLLYGFLIERLRSEGASSDVAFGEALEFFAPWFLSTLVILLILAKIRLRRE
ncbi:MAG: MFS transporter [Verrucomicrobiota bacterium]